MEKYLSLLWSSFRRIYGPLITIISIPLAIIIWIYCPDYSVKLAAIVPLTIFLMTIIVILLDFTITATTTITSLEKNQMPRILLAQKVQDRVQINCLLEPSELFSEGIAVSFFYAPPNNFEVLIGVGYVANINRDRKIQVLLTNPASGYEEQILGLINHNELIIRNVYIKPSVPRSYLGSMELNRDGE